MTNQEIINAGQTIFDEENVGANTSERVGCVIKAIGQNLASEETARQSADATLQGNINIEASTRESADTSLRAGLNTETQLRSQGDTSLRNDLNAEASARRDADDALAESIGSEETARENADTSLRAGLNTESQLRSQGDTSLRNDLNAEASARQSADTALQEAIDTEEAARESADTTLQGNIDAEAARAEAAEAALSEAIGAEEAARSSADTTLQGNIDAEASARRDADDALAESIGAEEAARSSADTTLQGNIDAEASARQSADAALSEAIGAEEAARSSADTTLQGNIDVEASARQSADAALSEAIGAEEAARSSADTTLQGNIDAESSARQSSYTAESSRAKASVGYFVCDTAASTAAKVVSATGFTLEIGGNVRIRMIHADVADGVTLNINGTGAKALYYKGKQASSSNSWKANEVIVVYYDGEKYICDNTGGMGDDEALVISNALNELKADEDNMMKENEALVISAALNELHSQIEEGGGGGSSAFAVSGEVTIANSEKITVVGSSFGTGSFNLAGKNWAAKLSLFSDYQFENISFDGFNYIAILRYLRLGNLTFSGRFALLCNNENNGDMSMAARLRSLENIATWMKTFGAEPILATSYPDLPYQSALWKEYAANNNFMFWDVAKYCSQVLGAKYGAWDSARHLATRNSQMVTDGYMPYMLAMERPRQSIKVFRLRSFVDYTNLDDLLFIDNGKRAEMFMELYFGTQCNTNPSSVDNISACVTGRLDNEYRTLQESGLLFSAPFLISAVIPVNASDLEMLSLNMSAGKAVKVYVMNRKKDPFPYGGNYTRFSVSNEVLAPSQGSVYSTGGTNYTVVSVVYGENDYYCTIYCSPQIQSSSLGAGTLTKVSGDGASSIPFALAEQSSLGGNDVAFTDTVGHWDEVTASGGTYGISGSLLKNCVEIDTVHFLVIPQQSDCLISNIVIKYSGLAIKPSATRRYFNFENSEFFDTDEIVQEPTFGDVGTTQTVWKDDDGNDVTSVADYEGKYPAGSSVVVVDDSTAIRQTIPSTSLHNGKYILQVVSRYFPPIYTDGSGNQITPDSFDYETLNVTVGSDLTQNNTQATLVDRVGTYWKISQFEIDMFYSENTTIRVSAGTKGLEVCKVSLKRKNINN